MLVAAGHQRLLEKLPIDLRPDAGARDWAASASEKMRSGTGVRSH